MTKTPYTFVVGVTLSLAACGGGTHRDSTAAIGTAGASHSPGNASLQERLEKTARPDFVANDDIGRHVWTEAQRFYKQNGYRLVWSDGKRLRSQFDGLLRALRAADQDGLDPAAYRIDELAAVRQARFDPARATDVDLLASYAYLTFAWHLTRGRSDPEDIDPHWHAAERQVDVHSVLETGVEENRVEESLKRLAPRSAQYGGLKQQLARYRAIEAKGGWPHVSDAPTLKAGIRDPAVPILRQRLAASGDFSGAVRASDADLYDDQLAEAVRRFQTRHGLDADGTYTRAVAAAVNVPLRERLEQIALNMERWRWLPVDLGSRYVMVNVPAFRLDAIENGRSVLGMKVVTGKRENRTPVLTDEITTVVFSPYWNIPPDIAQKETLPHVLKDPAYLERNNIEVVRNVDGAPSVVEPGRIDWTDADASNLRFRQRPGKGNSLGSVKFVFPNHYNVYLHDTPAQTLFNRVERDFSHGCVRLERPADLAAYALSDQPSWTQDRMLQAMNAGTEQSVPLKQPLPIYLVYFTAWEEQGTVHFREDVYGYDQKYDRKARTT